MNGQTLKLLEKALIASPDDWETRVYLIDQYLTSEQVVRASELLKAAPVFPDTEDANLLKVRVELETDLSSAQATLERILSRNKACAQGYLFLARLFMKRGLRDEARRKYGAATVIDESLNDPDLEQWLQIESELPVQKVAILHSETGNVGESTEEDSDTLTEEEDAGILSALKALETSRITFNDIGGMEDVIERIRMNIIYPFKNPEIFQKFKKKSGGGILMYGPPGCGKTHIARATAGECDATFISIAITDILSKWMGESEQHLHSLFEAARRRSPAIIFIDEIDAIGVNRSDASSSMAPLVNVLLTEMDGMSAQNENLMVMAATNAPWRVDSALRRPGRFDRVLFVPPPDLVARKAILEICLRDLPSESLDLEKLARLCDQFSGADLRAVIEKASEKAIYQEMRSGKSSKLTQKLLLESVKESRPSTIEWLETAKSYASYANRAGLYDDLVAFFEKA